MGTGFPTDVFQSRSTGYTPQFLTAQNVYTPLNSDVTSQTVGAAINGISSDGIWFVACDITAAFSPYSDFLSLFTPYLQFSLKSQPIISYPLFFDLQPNDPWGLQVPQPAGSIHNQYLGAETSGGEFPLSNVFPPVSFNYVNVTPNDEIPNGQSIRPSFPIGFKFDQVALIARIAGIGAGSAIYDEVWVGIAAFTN